MRRLAILTALIAPPVIAWGEALPLRETPIPPTTKGIPHKQFSGEAVPAIHAEMMRRVALLPKVDIRPTVVSLPGATGFWLMEDLSLARPEVIVGGREFAHVHPDGSLHASLPPGLAARAVRNGWAIPHPWSGQRPGWEGFVMIYTPLSPQELDVVFDLIVAGFDFVTKGDPDGAYEQMRPAAARPGKVPPGARRQDPTLLCSTC